MEKISFDADQLRSQFNNAITRIHKLEEENLTLAHMNDMYQEEISQKKSIFHYGKVLALESNHLSFKNHYATLKTQYEELLMRVTELHIENQSIHSSSQSSQSSTPSPQLNSALIERRERDEDLILNLREKIEKLSKKKFE